MKLQFSRDYNNGAILGFFNAFFTSLSKKLKKCTEKSIFMQNFYTRYFCIFLFLIFSLLFVNSSFIGILGLILICLTFIRSIFYYKKINLSYTELLVLGFLILLIISCCFSSLLIPSLKGLTKVLIYIGCFYSFTDFFKRNPKKILWTIFFIASCTILELLPILKQYIFGVNSLASWQDTNNVNPEQLLTRVYGTLKPYNPNLLAGFLLMGISCILGSSIYLALKKQFKPAFILTGCLIVSLFMLFLTGCRASYISLFCSFLMGSLLVYQLFKQSIKIDNKKIKKIFLIGILSIIAIGCILILLSPALQHRISSIFTLRGDSSNSYRMNVYIAGFKMLKDNFLIGIGTGNTTFRLVYGLYMVTGFDALGAYNIYLEMAIESGFFAPILFLLMVIYTFIKSVKTFLVTKFLENKIAILSCLMGIFAILIQGFFDTIWYRPQIQILFWLFLAILTVLITKKEKSNE